LTPLFLNLSYELTLYIYEKFPTMQNVPNTSAIKNWHEQDRPREKALHKGLDALSDSEIIAILLATGTKDRSALDLARDLLALADNNLDLLGKKPLTDFCKIRGMGPAKALVLAAAIELGRRRSAVLPDPVTIFTSSAETFRFLGSQALRSATRGVLGALPQQGQSAHPGRATI
jgi:DNA repair protein RadC